jgi:hypothetical protein
MALACVLDHIVQEAGDGLVLVAAVFTRQGTHRDDVRQVRNLLAVTSLFAMQILSPLQSLTVAGG